MWKTQKYLATRCRLGEGEDGLPLDKETTVDCDQWHVATMSRQQITQDHSSSVTTT